VVSRFRILGSVEVVTPDGALSLGGRRQVALLAYLLVRRNRRVSLDELIEAVWPVESPRGAAKRAQVAVARLRTTLAPLGPGPAVETVSGGYLLRAGPSDVDADVFSAGVELGSGELAAGDPERAAETLREALALWRGPALADVADEGFARAEVGVLEELRLRAVETRIEADLRLGRHREVLGSSRRWPPPIRSASRSSRH
jgi:DNA-binding SARP family transcriptional activator